MQIKPNLGAKTCLTSCNFGLCSNASISVRINTKTRGSEFKQPANAWLHFWGSTHSAFSPSRMGESGPPCGLEVGSFGGAGEEDVGVWGHEPWLSSLPLLSCCWRVLIVVGWMASSTRELQVWSFSLSSSSPSSSSPRSLVRVSSANGTPSGNASSKERLWLVRVRASGTVSWFRIHGSVWVHLSLVLGLWLEMVLAPPSPFSAVFEIWLQIHKQNKNVWDEDSLKMLLVG